MLYRSTRSNYTADSLNALLQGPAPDGGLFTDPDILSGGFDWQACIKLSTIDIAKTILGSFLPDISHLDTIVEKAYRGRFETNDLTPLVEVGDCHVLELFRGPTSAFKDVALSVLPHLMSGAMKQTGEKKILILTATSGDTGKAALEGFHDVEGIRIAVFYPENGVSPVQKLQMTTQQGNNVSVCSVKGNFDSCQSAVKEAFSSLSSYAQANGYRLSSANSINIGRLVPQTVYYFSAYRDLLKKGKIKQGDRVDFCVPTGNFGDILAGYWAKLLGLPVGKLICASNRNNILTDFFNTGVYDTRREFFRTTSPSMDILISSNLERLLFHAFGKDTEKVSSCMTDLKEKGFYSIPQDILRTLREDFSASFCSEEQCSQTIKQVWQNCGYLMDPHTSVAWHCAHTTEHSNPLVVLSTASPYKFPKSILSALNIPCSNNEFDMMKKINSLSGIPVPANLIGLRNKKERFTDSVSADNIQKYIKEKLSGETCS